jgi:hypothetical protein
MPSAQSPKMTGQEHVRKTSEKYWKRGGFMENKKQYEY